MGPFLVATSSIAITIYYATTHVSQTLPVLQTPRRTYTAVALCSIAALVLCGWLSKRLIRTRLDPDYAPKSKFGIVPLQNYTAIQSANGVDIIFVHGLGSNPDTTWCALEALPSRGESKGKKVCWIEDFLPKDIPDHIRKHVRMYYFNYDSYWTRDAVQSRLYTTAGDLLARMAAKLHTTAEERQRSLILVGHSYGGLVIKKALLQANKDRTHGTILGRTKAVFFLGTPHRGSSFSKWGFKLARLLEPLDSNPGVLLEMTYDSHQTTELHNDFTRNFGDSFAIYNYYEQRYTLVKDFWFWQWKEFCVTEQSATFGGLKVENVSLPVDHYELNKFRTPDDSNYELIRDNINLVLRDVMEQRGRVYSVPSRRVGTFVDRTQLAYTMREKIQRTQDRGRVPHAIVIHGLGGTGKTQLALDFVTEQEQKREYNPILWIDAETQQTVLESFERCMSDLGLKIEDQSASTTTLENAAPVRAVLRWLEHRTENEDPWLVVVDNADDVEWGIKKVIPQGPRGTVIVTSRDTFIKMLFDGACEELPVDIMEPTEARNLLLAHLQNAIHPTSETLVRGCDAIAAKLGFIALALDLAGAYISNETNAEKAAQNYLTDFDHHQDELLRNDEFRGLQGTDQTIWTVWDKTFTKLDQRYRDQKPHLLLVFFSKFQGATIQEELFRLASGGVTIPGTDEITEDFSQGLPVWLRCMLEAKDGKWNRFFFDKSLRLLRRYNMVRQVEGEWTGVTMHSLVRWRANQYLLDEPWLHWYTIFMLAATSQLLSANGLPQFQRHVIPHIGEIAFLERDDLSDSTRARILSTFACLYSAEGRYPETEMPLVRTIELREKAEEHLLVLETKGRLAIAYWNQGRITAAVQLQEQVLKSFQERIGMDSHDTMIAMANLGTYYESQKRWADAVGMQLQAVEAAERVYGKDAYHTLKFRTNLGHFYLSQGRLGKAEELVEQLMEAQERELGLEHHATLASMQNLTLIYGTLGKWSKAEELGRRLLEIRKQLWGEEHPHTLRIMLILANMLIERERYTEAVNLLRKCVQGFSEIYGSAHPPVLRLERKLHRWENKEY